MTGADIHDAADALVGAGLTTVRGLVASLRAAGHRRRALTLQHAARSALRRAGRQPTHQPPEPLPEATALALLRAAAARLGAERCSQILNHPQETNA